MTAKDDANAICAIILIFFILPAFGRIITTLLTGDIATRWAMIGWVFGGAALLVSIMATGNLIDDIEWW